MSRIGKQPVSVPPGVKVSVDDRAVTVSGPLGTLRFRPAPRVQVRWDESVRRIVVSVDEKDREDAQVRATWGTTRAIIRNMVEGVQKGYEKSLEVVGVGWTAAVSGGALRLSVGYASPVVLPIPEGLRVSVDRQIIRITGADRQAVGQFAAMVRAVRKPEPYQGKGIKYTDEVIHRKQGKQFGA